MIPLRAIGARAVLPGDPLAIGACGDIFDPILTVEIPTHRLAQSARKALARHPTELTPDLAGVDRIAPVMTGTIGHEGDLSRVGGAVAARALLVQNRTEQPDQGDIRNLVARADVVGLARPAVGEHA